MMKFGSLGAAVAAMSIGLCALPVHAAQITIEQYIQTFGDLIALETLCPDLDGRDDVIKSFMKENGLTEDLMSDKTGYLADVFEAEKASFAKRKVMSRGDNCADALRLYGEDGTVIKGLLFKKAASSN